MKKEIPPFKMIPVSMRERLHEFTGSELKVFMCLYLHSGKDSTAYPTNELMMQETGLSHNTLQEAKQGLRKKGFSVALFQRKRNDGSLSSMTEKLLLPIPGNRGGIPPEIGDTSAQESGVGYPQISGGHEVDTGEADTGNVDTGKPQDQNRVSELVSEEGSSLRSSPIAGDKRETRTKPVQVCEQEQEQSQHLHEEQPKPVPFIPDTDEDDDEMHNCHGFRVTDEQAAFYDPGVYSSRLGRDLDREEYLVADDLYFDLLPDREAEEEDVVLLAELALEFTAQTVRAAWSFNQRHKNGKLKLFGVPDLAAALRSDSDRCLLNQLRAHDENIEACEKCEGLRRCSHCLHVEDMTQSQHYGTGDGTVQGGPKFYLHKGCERAHAGD